MYQCELLAVLMLVSLINWKLEVILQIKIILCTGVPLCIIPCQSHGAIYTQLLHNSGPRRASASIGKVVCHLRSGTISQGFQDCCGVGLHVVWKMDLITKHIKTCHLSPIHDGILKVAIELNSETYKYDSVGEIHILFARYHIQK